MRHTPTEAERKLWLLLRHRRFVDYKFRRQVPIGSYIADFLCYRARLIIELDGRQHLDSQRDQTRDAWLASQDFYILRIWNNNLNTDPNGVLDAIWHALQGV